MYLLVLFVDSVHAMRG